MRKKTGDAMTRFLTSFAFILLSPAAAGAADLAKYDACLKTFMRSELMIRMMLTRGETLPADGIAAFSATKEDYLQEGMDAFGYDQMTKLIRLGEDDTIDRNPDLNLIARVYVSESATSAFEVAAVMAAKCGPMDSPLMAYVRPIVEKSDQAQ